LNQEPNEPRTNLIE